MHRRQQSIADTLQRVQNFLDEHDDVFAELNATPARAKLDAAVTAFQAAGVTQATRKLELKGQLNKQLELERVLLREHVTPIAKFARAQVGDDAKFSALAVRSRHLYGSRLVDVARAMAEAAQQFEAVFIAAKFAPDFIAQLKAATDAVAVPIGVRMGKRSDRVVATKRLEVVLRSGRAAVASLDAVVPRFVGTDSKLLTGWWQAKRVEAKPGAKPGAKKKAKPPAAAASVPEPIPAPAPAADATGA